MIELKIDGPLEAAIKRLMDASWGGPAPEADELLKLLLAERIKALSKNYGTRVEYRSLRVPQADNFNF